MPSPAPALLVLRRQIDDRWPNRSRASDGIMGDAAHRARKSAHNEGNAYDLTVDPLNGPDVGGIVQGFCRQMRANPDGRLRLMIFRRRIYSARDGWQGRPYFGINPHDRHAHIEVEPRHRDEVRPWHLF